MTINTLKTGKLSDTIAVEALINYAEFSSTEGQLLRFTCSRMGGPENAVAYELGQRPGLALFGNVAEAET